jgi:hypothetical protein
MCFLVSPFVWKTIITFAPADPLFVLSAKAEHRRVSPIVRADRRAVRNASLTACPKAKNGYLVSERKLCKLIRFISFKQVVPGGSSLFQIVPDR